jgi:hypothetical protein
MFAIEKQHKNLLMKDVNISPFGAQILQWSVNYLQYYVLSNLVNAYS